MTEVYTQEAGKLVRHSALADRCWVNLVAPSRGELTQLEERYGLPQELLAAALDPDERARHETDEGATLIVLRIPILNDPEASLTGTPVPYLTRPLGIILKGNVVVTICLVENAILREFIEGRIRRFDPEEEIRFTLQLFYRTSMHYLRYLRDLNAATSEVERKLQRSQKNQDLLELMNNEKSLVYFTTSLRSNQLMMERFKKTAYFRKAIEDERDLLEDIIIDNAQAIEMANIYMSIMSGLMDTFASVISNNLNVVMKRLTKITIILMLPTFVASLYGMNVQLPGAESPYAFAVILALSLVLIVLGFFVFSDRRF